MNIFNNWFKKFRRIELKHTDLCLKQKPCENACAELTLLNIYGCDLDSATSEIEGFSDDAALVDDLHSKLTASNMNVNEYLGGIKKDASGKITNATAIKVTFINAVSADYPVDDHHVWEKAYLDYIQGVRYDIH